MSEIKSILVDTLSTLEIFKTNSSQTHAIIRCPFCGDSHNATSAHMYIKLTEDKFPYYCHKCHEKGLVDGRFLDTLEIGDNELYHNLSEHNKKRSITRHKSGTKLNIKFPPIKLNKRNMFKLNYINHRLGLELTLDDMIKYKIIFSLYDFLEYNGIDYLTCPDYMADDLDNNFIGFVSADNQFIVMRNLSKKKLSHIRYYNYSILSNNPSAKKYYICPTSIDLMADKFTIVMAEGVFDIMGAFNLIESIDDNTIFVAVCGSDYLVIILDLIRLGILNMDIYIYADNDQPIHKYKKLKSDIPINVNMKVHYNKLEKDFGVSKDRIEINTFRI